VRLADRAKIAAELQYGITLGLTPRQELDETEGQTVTLLSSWWNHLRCTGCGHTFRRGDRVRVSQRMRTVVHLVPGLDCGAPADNEPAASASTDIAAFREGLLSAWPAPEGTRIMRLPAGDWRIPDGPDDVRDTNVCLHCGHTFRAGEYVVVCPCRPMLPLQPGGTTRPAACGRGVHRDPAIGLSCWESWRPDGTVTVCPVTQTKVSQP
jgi:hypothetical protein